jgi:prepilin-type N-terminal cleavage/methylation domain-containing protein
MIPRPTNSIKRKQIAGVTLIECLAVLTILAGLVAAVGSSFILTLKSYVGEYSSEAVELESQRAALELEYYAARAVRMEILDGGVSGSSGAQINLYQDLTNTANVVSFVYTPDLTRCTGTYGVGVSQVGSLAISASGSYYVYSTNVVFTPVAGSLRPFVTSSDGGVSFRWTISTSSGPVKMGGTTSPGT